MNILYISYDGMTDPLGQSQVLPYLIGLSEKGHSISLLSAEKPAAFQNGAMSIKNLTKAHSIDWHYVTYTSKPPVLSTLMDLYRLKRYALQLHKEKPFDIVHCRSYIAALIGLYFKKKLSIPFVFDMRGFWADERVEGNIWNLKNPIFKFTYNYFKRKEKQFLNNSSHIVVLTEKGKAIVKSWLPHSNNIPVSVVPCCVDTNLFSHKTIDKETKENLKQKLNISKDDKIISYLGSLGTWYMPDEMMAFYKELISHKPEYRFLFITPDKPTEVYKLAQKHDVAHNLLIIVKAKRDEVPALLSLSEVSLFFIRPVFSKQASSPTKQAEVLSMGIPVICNDGIGDTAEIMRKYNAGIVVDAFSTKAYADAIDKIGHLLTTPKEAIRNVALELFSLEKGVNSYHDIYTNIK